MAKVNNNKVQKNDDDEVVAVNETHFDITITKEGGGRLWQWSLSAASDHPTESGVLSSGRAKTTAQCSDAIEMAIAAEIEASEEADETDDDEVEAEPVKPAKRNKNRKPKADDDEVTE